MRKYLCVKVGYLLSECHARGEMGQPEWPPSPLRVFQALVAAAAARNNERTILERYVPALSWLENLPPPIVVAPEGISAKFACRFYVPDNIGDKVAASWSRGSEASLADYKSEKGVRPTRVPLQSFVHYLWEIDQNEQECEKHIDAIKRSAQSITHLGWGVDMVHAEASLIDSDEADQWIGDRWTITDDRPTIELRVPVSGTLNNLIDKHKAFLNRFGSDGFRPVAPLGAFRMVGYGRAIDRPGPAFAAFSILHFPDCSGYRAFDTTRKGMVVAAMTRHAASHDAIVSALGWSDEKKSNYILGHSEDRGSEHVPVSGSRLAYLPIPSIEFRGKKKSTELGYVRRVMIAATGVDDGSLRSIARLLSGAELTMEGVDEPVAILSRITDHESMIRRYTKPASTWATVTPVVLPGYDDPRKIRNRIFPMESTNENRIDNDEKRKLLEKLDSRIEHLLRKAILQAGYGEMLARHAEIDWRSSGFWPGADLASKYAIPDKLRRFRRLHVRITWRNASGSPIKLAGPIFLGGGRFVGLGLFAAMSD